MQAGRFKAKLTSSLGRVGSGTAPAARWFAAALQVDPFTSWRRPGQRPCRSPRCGRPPPAGREGPGKGPQGAVGVRKASRAATAARGSGTSNPSLAQPPPTALPLPHLGARGKPALLHPSAALLGLRRLNPRGVTGGHGGLAGFSRHGAGCGRVKKGGETREQKQGSGLMSPPPRPPRGERSRYWRGSGIMAQRTLSLSGLAFSKAGSRIGRKALPAPTPGRQATFKRCTR